MSGVGVADEAVAMSESLLDMSRSNSNGFSLVVGGLTVCLLVIHGLLAGTILKWGILIGVWMSGSKDFLVLASNGGLYWSMGRMAGAVVVKVSKIVAELR